MGFYLAIVTITLTIRNLERKEREKNTSICQSPEGTEPSESGFKIFIGDQLHVEKLHADDIVYTTVRM